MASTIIKTCTKYPRTGVGQGECDRTMALKTEKSLVEEERDPAQAITLSPLNVIEVMEHVKSECDKFIQTKEILQEFQIGRRGQENASKKS